MCVVFEGFFLTHVGSLEICYLLLSSLKCFVIRVHMAHHMYLGHSHFSDQEIKLQKGLYLLNFFPLGTIDLQTPWLCFFLIPAMYLSTKM